MCESVLWLQVLNKQMVLPPPRHSHLIGRRAVLEEQDVRIRRRRWQPQRIILAPPATHQLLRSSLLLRPILISSLNPQSRSFPSPILLPRRLLPDPQRLHLVVLRRRRRRARRNEIRAARAAGECARAEAQRGEIVARVRPARVVAVDLVARAVVFAREHGYVDRDGARVRSEVRG